MASSILGSSVLTSPVPPPKITTAPIAPPNMRALGDVGETRKRIYANVLTAVNGLKPLENKRHTLSLQNVVYADPDKRTIAEEKQAILNNQSMGRRLRGTWTMRDKETGDIVDTRTMTVGSVPHMTGRGTFINNGSEYTLNNQVRLKPGLFTRIKDNGEVETHANIMPGKGRAHRYFLDPEKGVFYLRIQQAKIPLMPLMRAMGVSDKDLRKAWGNELYTANALQDKPSALAKLYTKVLRNSSEMSGEEKKLALVEAFESMELDPKVTERTLKKPYANLSKDAILDVTKRLLAVSRGEADVDDRDHLAYQRFYGAEDLLAERIARDHGGIQRQLFHKASFKKNLQGMPTGALTRQLDSTILRSGLGQALEEINNAEILDKQSKVTRMGEGGIPSAQSIPEEARSVQPSHLGFIDPIRTPECYDEKTEVMTKAGWKFWSEVVETDELACMVDGQLEFHPPDKLVSYHYRGPMYGARTSLMGYLVTPKHRMRVRKGNDTPHWRMELAEQTHDSCSCLVQCGGHAAYQGSSKAAGLSGDDLCDWAKSFGKSDSKSIPEVCFDWPVDARRALLAGLLLGGGQKDVKGSRSGQATRYCADSRQLADDVHRLLFSLGISSCIVFEPDDRKGHYLGCWVVHVHTLTTRTFTRGHKTSTSDFYIENYDGQVYCASVPGGQLYVRREDGGGFWCGNSLRIGVDTFVARNAKKGDDGLLYGEFIDPKTGKTAYKSSGEIADKTIAFPRSDIGDYTAAMQDGQMKYVHKNDVDFVLPHMENSMSPLGNLIPLKSASKAQRSMMGSRMLTQALPLLQPEAPLVQSGVPGEDDKSFEELYSGHMGAKRASDSGVVTGIDKGKISVKYANGQREDIELYHNFPYSRKTYLHQTPVVEVGQRFEKSDLLARSNFTDEKGTTALGINARVAYIPWKGANFEDAIVISQGMANRLSSEHMYQTKIPLAAETKLGKGSFISLFGKKFDRAQLETIDDEGVVLPGTSVKKGDPLVLAANPRPVGHHKVHKKGAKSFTDSSEVWKHHEPGVVTDVVKSSKGVSVLVKATMPMQPGDKLSNRYGGKGVVSEIIEDSQMPKDKDGNAFEILLNPLGVISRGNPSQVVETALGKIAAKTGKAYKIKDFEDIEDLVKFAIDELKKNGMTSRGDVIDPEIDRKILDSAGRSPLTGNAFFLKLHHTAESKGQARSIGGYTQSGEPAKGGEAGSKRLALLETSALLSHGATAVIQDAALIRGQRNEDFWLSFMQGNTPAKPKVPMVFEKFVNELKGAGINVVPDGHKLNIMALTNKDVDTLSGNREIKNGDTVHFEKDMLPVPGGLFDPSLTGGHDGCFHPSVTVLTEHGPKPIGEIVNSRLACRVWTYNWTKLEFELKPVVNWFKNKSPEGIGRAVFQGKQPGRLSATARRYNPRTLWGTRGHQVYASDGCKQDLASAKKLLFVHEKLTYTQEQLVYGSLLGDGHVKETGQYSECHSSRQAGYLQLKYDILRPLCNYEPKAFTDTSGGLCREKVQFITVAHTAMHEARALCYAGHRKTLSDEWLSRVDDMGLAFFVFDDGHVCRRKDKNTVYICLSTHCFSRQEIEKLRTWLASRWGLDTWAYRDNKRYGDRDCGWTIDLAGDSALRLLEIIAPFAEDSVRYKFPPLPRTSRCGCGKEISRQRRMCNQCQLDKAKKCGSGRLPKDVRRLFGGVAAVRELLAANAVPVDVLCPSVWHRIYAALGSAVAAMRTDTSLTYALREEPVKYRWQTGSRWERTETVYDIEVADNHNYVANGALVSNSRWSHIKLHEPMPNPVMEEPIRKLLGITQKEFENVLAGKTELLGRKGPGAISFALGRINVPREIAAARMAVSSGKKTLRDKAVQKLSYLKAAARLNIHPREWVLDKVPVLPPRFRPISMIEENNLPLVADPNYLYKELIDANTNLKELSTQVDDTAEERLTLYKAFKAVTGLADPTHPKLVEKNVSGLLKSIFGKSPKFGTVQRKLLSSTTDLVGRATVTPDASLDMDSVGLPEERAWEIYKPFIIRRLRRAGNPLLVAAEKVKNKDPEARKHLVDELDVRPVFVNRAPVLHRFGVMAFKPRLVKGETLRVSPLIVGGFNMDFDGDAVQYHVPAGKAAVDEALDRMLPSRSLLSPVDFKSPVHKPGQEYVGGLYEATKKIKGKGVIRKFMTEADAVRAYKRGDIAPYDMVKIIK